MKRIHVVGRKNHGKTTLVVELVQALSSRGLRVGTIKHTHHQHQLDSPGKDSHRHQEAGAVVSGICSPTKYAVFWNHDRETPQEVSDDEQKYAAFAPMFVDCDVVVVEGDSQTLAAKIEVWRSAVGTKPIAEDDDTIVAIISDDELDQRIDVPVWPRSNLDQVVTNLLSLI